MNSNRVAGVFGSARPGRNHETLEGNLGRFFGRHLVVADDQRLGPQLTQVLDQVVGEGVVVVEDQNEHEQTLDARRHQTPDANSAIVSRHQEPGGDRHQPAEQPVLGKLRRQNGRSLPGLQRP